MTHDLGTCMSRGCPNAMSTIRASHASTTSCERTVWNRYNPDAFKSSESRRTSRSSRRSSTAFKVINGFIEAIAAALSGGSALLTECFLLKNNLDVHSATMLAKIGAEKRIMLSHIMHNQMEADCLQPVDGILIASDRRITEC